MYIEIDKRVQELNDSQAFVYMLIVYNKLQHRQINRQYLANALGVTSKDYITEIITAIEKVGIIKRKNRRVHSYSEGGVDVKLDGELKYNESYKVSIDFVRDRNVTPKVKGFALRYRSLTSYCLDAPYNKKDIAILLNVSRPTLNKYLALMENTEKYFFKGQPRELLTVDEVKIVKRLASEECVDSKIKRCCQGFLEKKLQNRKNCKTLFDRAVSGTLFKKTTNKKKDETSDSRYSLGD